MTTGILLVDKPPGVTSHDVVARVRRIAGTRKVGHAGTLDPMATGLLVLGLGSATRLLTYLVGLDKEYFATIRLGQATTTDDAEGEPIGSPADTTRVSLAAIEAVIAGLTGQISQRPSSVSAIKVDGKRAYSLVREGETVELAERPVTVRTFEVLRSQREPWLELDVRIECSTGTYVRALARDLGEALGVGGHLSALRRTKIGPFDVKDASALDDSLLNGLLESASVAGELFPTANLTAQEAVDLAMGKAITVAVPDSEGRPIAAIAPDGRLVGLFELVGGRSKVLSNFPTNDVVKIGEAT
jgi:tRNA pseudouridine55 synthase